jgi:fluoroacetyl-CoA thioesterase
MVDLESNPAKHNPGGRAMTGERLQAGMTFELQYQVPENKTVPHLFPEFEEGRVMPKVLATGFMIGLFEFTCIKGINPHIDWPREQSVGIHIDVSHLAATSPGMTVNVKATLEKVEGRKLTFHITAHDGVDKISEGTHQRFIIDGEKFNAAVAQKKSKA